MLKYKHGGNPHLSWRKTYWGRFNNHKCIVQFGVDETKIEVRLFLFFLHGFFLLWSSPVTLWLRYLVNLWSVKETEAKLFRVHLYHYTSYLLSIQAISLHATKCFYAFRDRIKNNMHHEIIVQYSEDVLLHLNVFTWVSQFHPAEFVLDI